MTNLTNDQIVQLNHLNVNTITMEFGDKIQDLIDSANNVTSTGTPVNAVNASKVLTISGVVVHGETVTINNPETAGTDVYEFLADDEQVKTIPTNIAVDITAHVTNSLGSLTIDTQPTSGDTMTIGVGDGVKVYTFVPVGTDNADGEVSRGTSLATAKTAIVAAINGTDGVSDPHTQVVASAFVGDICAIEALIGGVSGDLIELAETFTAGTNIFDGVTLGSGADCSATNAVIALVTAVTASDTQGISAADGTGDTVDITSDVAGVIGNGVVIGETMANGAFAGGAVLLSGGINGSVGLMTEAKIDATYLYKCIADNTISGKNWRRMAIGSAY